ncbi:MAG: hypothetical protein ABSC06_03935 [Rhodopila sp.]|jgi:hypothetical protein
MLVTRIFSTDADATAAVSDLTAVGFRDVRTIDKSGSDVTAASLVAQGVSEDRASTYADSVNEGGTLVIVSAPLGAGQTAKDILERRRPNDAGEPVAAYETASPAAAATKTTTPTSAKPAAGDVDWSSAAPLSSKFGWPVLLDDPAPLSKWLNWRTLSDAPTKKPLSHGLPFLSDDPTPLSSKLGWKVLSDDPTPLSTRSGRKVLSDDPTPLSNRIGKNVLSDDPTPLSSRLGWKVLLSNPTPLSSWLNLSVLSAPKSSRP